MAQLVPLEPVFERLPASEKKYSESVVFVHHYGGNRHSFHKQMEFVNSIGFDVVTFDLPLRQLNQWPKNIPVSKDWRFGLRHIWADKIDEVLCQIPEKKFIYSFSSPSMAALMAIAKRHAFDVSGWICDGGPFANLVDAIDNLLREGSAEDLKSRWYRYPVARRLAAQIFARSMGAHNFELDMKKCFRTITEDLPVLSFRSLKDPLVPPSFIDDFFKFSSSVQLQTVDLANSGHLTGFMQNGDIYREALSEFLIKNGHVV